MRRGLRSEWRKLRATPTMWWLLAATTLLAVAAAIGAFVLGDARNLAPDSDQALADAMHSVAAGSLLVMVAGIVGMAGEFRFGQADQTFLSTPRRTTVVGAKTIIFGLLGLMFGVVASVATVAATWIWLMTQGVDLPLDRSVVWLTLVGGTCSAALFAILGVAVGAASRNQVGAVTVGVAWLVVFEPIVFQASATVGRWLPGTAALALRRVPEDGLLSMGTGGLVLVGWIMAVSLIALRRTLRNDIT